MYKDQVFGHDFQVDADRKGSSLFPLGSIKLPELERELRKA